MAKPTARVVLGAAAVLWATGCGGGGGGPGSCPQDLPTACPGPMPTYAADVAPVVTRRCRACHTAGGVEETAPFDTHQQIHARRAEIQARLQACLMPPADQPQLTAAERAALLGWLVCGARND